MHDRFAKPPTYITGCSKVTNVQRQKKNFDNAAKRYAMIENDSDHFGDNRPKVGIDFANKMRTLRNNKEWTQKDLALRAGVKVDVVRDYESGNAEPNSKLIRKFEQVLGSPLR